jgi:hypothetical protein
MKALAGLLCVLLAGWLGNVPGGPTTYSVFGFEPNDSSPAPSMP